MCTGLCRKLRRRYAAVLLLAGAAVLLVARRESPVVDSELRLVEETISAEVGRLSGSKAAAAGPAGSLDTMKCERSLQRRGDGQAVYARAWGESECRQS